MKENSGRSTGSRGNGENSPVASSGDLFDLGDLFTKPWMRSLFRPGMGLLSKALGFSQLQEWHDQVSRPPCDGSLLVRRVLRELGVSWNMDPAEKERLKKSQGPMILVANHPFGGWEFFALADLLEEIRPGQWRFLANRFLYSVETLRPQLIPVDPLGKGHSAREVNWSGLRRASRHLKGGGVLGIFPAGRVSARWRDYGDIVADGPWSDHYLRLAQMTGASVAGIAVPGQNRSVFLRLPWRWPYLRAAFLAREFIHRPEKNIRLHLAWAPQKSKRIKRDLAAEGRARIYVSLEKQRSGARETRGPQKVSTDVSKESGEANVSYSGGCGIRQELENSLLLGGQGTLDLYFLQGCEAPLTLRALGAARERTFRAAGQGTGRSLDLAPEDGYYHHLILWDNESELIVGSYRIGLVDQIISEQGVRGLYLAKVFSVRKGFFDEVGPSLELSRSFIVPEWQRDRRGLSLLWAGLARIAGQKKTGTLFGSVTISNKHHPLTRALLVDYLRNNYEDEARWRRFWCPRKPFQPTTRYHGIIGEQVKNWSWSEVSSLVKEIEEGERGVPPLLRYYCNLGARFLSFHVEEAFQEALYCLLRVDMSKIPKAYYRKFGGVLS